MGTLFQDLRYGLRMLAKNPGFTAVAVLTLAVGIGANTAIFSVVNAVMLRPLPYREPNRLVQVLATNPKWNAPIEWVSVEDFLEMRGHIRSFDGLAVAREDGFALTGHGQPLTAHAWDVSPGFFELLGITPLLGRPFLSEEAQPGRSRVVVLSHALWQLHFGLDAGIIGRTITLNGTLYTVIGVMPAGFGFPESDTDLWVPLLLVPGDPANNNMDVQIFARLGTGVRPNGAQGEVDAIAEQLAATHPMDKGRGLRLAGLQAEQVKDVRRALLVLLAAVGLVLLIACANVGSLSLARGSFRQRELAVRTAIGASRRRLVRQLFTESMMLALMGGGLGLILGQWGLDFLLAIGPKDIPRLNEVMLDRWVIAFTLGVSLLSTVLFGLAPALAHSKSDLQATLKDGVPILERPLGPLGLRNLRGLLVLGETALALVLLIGAGLLIRSFERLSTVDLGFDPDHLLKVPVGLSSWTYRTAEQRSAFFDQLLSRVRSLPGVKSAAITNGSILNGGLIQIGLKIEGRPQPGPEMEMDIEVQLVSPEFFRTMGIRLLEGRQFTEHDRPEAPAVAVVNQALGRRYWQGESPIGHRVSLSWEAKWREIVGLVNNSRDAALDTEPKPEVYVPYAQRALGSVVLEVRTASPSLGLAGAVRRQVWEIDKDLPVGEIETMNQTIAHDLAEPRFRMFLLGLFAGLALILTAVGIFGVVSYSVTQRTREIGIRMALGAAADDVLKMVVRQGAILTAIGIAAGLVAALSLTRLMASLLYGVRPTDPVTLVTVSLVLAVVALLASYIPARRATKVDPTVALRHE